MADIDIPIDTYDENNLTNVQVVATARRVSDNRQVTVGIENARLGELLPSFPLGTEYDIRKYKLAPDADYGPAILAAANAASAAGGGTVVIPDDTYTVNTFVGNAPMTGDGIKRAVIYLRGLTNVVIRGLGPSSVLTTTVQKTSVLELRDCVGCRVHGLGVVATNTWYQPGTGATPKQEVAGSCIRLTTCDRCEVSSCDVSKGAFGVYLTGGTTSSFVRDNQIHDCSLSGVSNGINEDDYTPEHGLQPKSCFGNQITGNSIVRVDGSGSIVLDNSTTPSYTIVSNNVIRGNAGGQGIRLLNAVTFLCTNNVIENTKNEGIYIAQAWSNAFSRHSTVVAQNVISNCGNRVTGVDCSGIKIANGPTAGVDTIQIHDNVVRLSGLHGIEAVEPKGLSIANNSVSGSEGHGVYLVASAEACKHFKVFGNSSRFNKLDGIRIESTAAAGILQEFLVQGNTISDCGRNGLVLAQTATLKVVGWQVIQNMVASCGTSAAGTYSGMVIDGTRGLLALNNVENNGAVAMKYSYDFGTNVSAVQWVLNQQSNAVPNGGGLNGGAGSGVRVVSITSTGVGIGANTFANYTLDVSGAMRVQGSQPLVFGGSNANDHDVTLFRPAADRLQLSTGDALELGSTAHTGGQYLQFFRQTADPAAPPAGGVRVFAKDSGAGKLQLAVRFPTGATQIVATEP